MSQSSDPSKTYLLIEDYAFETLKGNFRHIAPAKARVILPGGTDRSPT